MAPGQEAPEQGQSNRDIEHAPVPDDPRAWSNARKTLTLTIVSLASMIAGIATTCQNPANAQIEQDLHVSSSGISWSMSVFVLVQGLFPLVWSAVSEIKGRKVVYVSSMSLFIIGSATVAMSSSIGLVIGMRAVQAAGSSAVMAIAAATLADIYEPHERGTKMGIYYSAPLLGTSVGPFFGGIFAQAFGWRAVFWFSLIAGGVVLISLVILFKDSFRKERSLSYQNIIRTRLEHHPSMTGPTRSGTAESSAPNSQSQQVPSEKTEEGLEFRTSTLQINDITLSFADVNPFPPSLLALKRWNNNTILLASGLIFGFTYSLTYTCAITLSIKYGYGALYTGLVLLAYGMGSMCGSIVGGRWSDRRLTELKCQHEGNIHPEMRLRSTLPAMPWLPLSCIGYAWICQTHQPIASICVMLFILGLSATWIYTSTLAYIVDANTGRSSTAVALNSVYRGTLAFVAAEIAIPLQNTVGDGGLYTFWAGLMLVMEVLVLLTLKFGKQWRERSEEIEKGNDI